MSQVRMCDQCSRIFSENAEGWETYSATRQITQPDGRKVTQSIQRDACPDCAFHPEAKPTFAALETKDA